MKKTNLQIKNKDNTELDTDIYFSEKSNISPLLIFAHGFKGFKDWGGFPYMMEKLSVAGYTAVSFNFSYNGVEKNYPVEFTRLDLFAKNTFSRELEDLHFIINYFYNNSTKYNIDRKKIGLIGHSRGGGIVILETAGDTRISSVITLSAVSNFDRYSSEHKKKWREKGYFEILNTRTNQVMRLNSTLLDDIENNKERLNILNAARKINIPFLIIHGKEDLSVKFTEGEEIYNNSNKTLSKFFPVEKTGHTFGIVHPFQGTTKSFELVIEKMNEFLRNNCKF